MVYFDNSSTTKPCERAVLYTVAAMRESWGNPSSLHRLGIEAEIAVTNARIAVAKTLKCRPEEIIFTSGGTEANNTAVFSAAAMRKARGRRVVTTSVEHPSVLQAVKRLESEGFEVCFLKPGADGVISLADLERALTKDTVLVSIMLVNNETGSIQPVKEAAKIVKNLSPHAIVHCDAVQAYGKLPINVHDLSVDLFSASGHKIQGPKGVGFLYCKKGLRLPPLLEGGGQENGFRSGTEPVPLICGLQGAVEELPDTAKQLSIQQELFDYAKQRLLETGLVKMNSPDGCLPYILNFSMPGYRSEILLHFLEQREIYVSSGSACARGHGSYVLAEMGFDSRRQDSALRISFSKDNKIEEVDTLIDALIDAAGRLRKV